MKRDLTKKKTHKQPEGWKPAPLGPDNYDPNVLIDSAGKPIVENDLPDEE